MPDTCPACSGPRMTGDPTGLRVQHALACRLLAAEDQTRAADVERARGWRYTRAATPAEVELLAALGHPLPPGAVTSVEPLTTGVLRRSWVGIDLDAPPTTLTTEETP